MSKIVVVDNHAAKEINKFPKSVRIKIDSRIKILKRDGKLEEPFGKKIGQNLFEIRMSYQGQWRVIYAYVQDQYIVLLLAFNKKTQKTPRNEIVISKQRLEKYI